MTTKELINQYVTAHADNRWMDASELEALLTEFAEKLKELASEDLEQAAEECVDGEDYPYIDRDGLPLYTPDYLKYMFRQGAQWDREQMMKGAIDAQVSYLANERTGMKSLRAELPIGTKLDFGDKVKVIIIKE